MVVSGNLLLDLCSHYYISYPVIDYTVKTNDIKRTNNMDVFNAIFMHTYILHGVCRTYYDNQKNNDNNFTKLKRNQIRVFEERISGTSSSKKREIKSCDILE